MYFVLRQYIVNPGAKKATAINVATKISKVKQILNSIIMVKAVGVIRSQKVEEKKCKKYKDCDNMIVLANVV